MAATRWNFGLSRPVWGIAARCAAGAALCATAVPALAVGPADNPYAGGTHLPGPPAAEFPENAKLSDEDRARVTLLKFSDCVVRLMPRAVDEALALGPWTKQADQRLKSLATPDCLAEGELQMTSSLMRGALYTSLYRRRFGTNVPAALPVSVDFRQGAQPPFDAQIEQEIGLREFGDCVVRRDVGTVHSLVLAAPGTARERQDIGALSPDFSACLTRGTTIRLNKMLVIAILSEALYRDAAASAAVERG